MKLGLNLGLNQKAQGGSVSALDTMVLDIDATQSASYSGSGTDVLNLVASPADGSAQSAYDFTRGNGSTSSTFPTFNGSAGSASAYWSFDGGDYFLNKNSFTDMVTPYNMHKSGASGQKWWAAIAYRSGGATLSALFGTGWTSADIGSYLYMDPDGNKILYRVNGSTLTGVNFNGAVNNYTNSSDNIIIVSADMSLTTNNVRMWVNSGTGVTVSQNYGTFTTNNDNANFAIGGTFDEGTIQGPLLNSARLYAFSMGNVFLDDAGAAEIFNLYETRHGRDYTP